MFFLFISFFNLCIYLSSYRTKKLQIEPRTFDEKDIFDKPIVEHSPLQLGIFKNKYFFLYGEFSSNNYHDLQRFITIHDG